MIKCDDCNDAVTEGSYIQCDICVEKWNKQLHAAQHWGEAWRDWYQAPLDERYYMPKPSTVPPWEE